MPINRNLIITSIFFLCSTFIKSADNSRACTQQLIESGSLANHISDWPQIIMSARTIIAQGGSVRQLVCDSSTAFFQAIEINSGQGRKWIQLPNARYLVLKKEYTKGVELEFSDYAKSFVANDIGIKSIGYFLCPSLASGMCVVMLNGNNLTSFTEIQEKIVSQCPLLKTLIVDRNKFVGTVSISHEKLEVFSATYNNFSSLGTIYLPSALSVDLSFNKIICTADTPDATVDLKCYSFRVDNNTSIGIESTYVEI